MKNTIINIVLAIFFIFGFYFGSTVSFNRDNPVFDFSANAAMIPESDKKDSLYKLSSILSGTLRLDLDNSEKDETESAPSPTPDYPKNTPVLASNAGEKLNIKNDTPYDVNIDELLAEPLLKHSDKIKVLILHTHTSEAYTPSENYPYDMTDSYRTRLEDRNVVAVGNVIENILGDNGIEVIHDKTSHDYPSYTGSYRRALETIEKNLAANPDISLVLDIHRDAIADENGNYLKTQAVIDGNTCAQAMLVVGTDYGGLEHPNWRENLKYALHIQKIMCKKYPSLARDIHLREERFNGHAREGELIIEVGSNGNTLDEAIKCAEYVANCIVQMINEESQTS
ncbi:MAG: stage II sporulation protein P [Clostridia bacterium]|nr:stage II sporulation protein P [Clostridia bacterium]